MRTRARLARTLAPDSCDTRRAARAMYGSRGSLRARVCGRHMWRRCVRRQAWRRAPLHVPPHRMRCGAARA
eukprot:2022779-Prymnesium_polylepis.1